MGSRRKVILCTIILIAILFTGCKNGDEEGGESTYKDKERERKEPAEIVDQYPEEVIEKNEVPEGLEEDESTEEIAENERADSKADDGEVVEENTGSEAEGMEPLTDSNKWIRFNETFFQDLIEQRNETKTRLTYEDFYRNIDYRLMMEEETVIDLFGAPNERVEDPFAYRMYILEYDGLIVYVNDYGHGLYATGYYVKSPDFLGPRGTKVGQSVGEVLLAYPLPDRDDYTVTEGQIHWGDQTEYYGAHMALIHHLENGEITELRFAESSGLAGVAYEIVEGVVQSIYFFEMN